jgi:hypothetical protein
MRWQRTVGRHRDPASVRLGRWLTGLATAAVVVAVGGAVTSSELSYDERFREFVTTGAMGDWVSGGTFDVSVVAVRTAATIDDDGLTLDTAGAWVLVRMRVMATEEAEWLDYATVRDSAGHTWSATQRIDQPLVDNGYRLDPRIPVEGEVVFEVPQDAATGLTLRVGQANGLYGLQMASVVEVPLPIDETMLAGGLGEPEPAVIEFPKIVIADPQVLHGVEEAGR